MRWRDVKQNRIPPKNGKKRSDKKSNEQKFVYASIFDRIKAFITDSFLLAMPVFYLVIYLLFDGLKGDGGVGSHKLLAWSYILLLLGGIVTIFYIKTGQTPGLKAYDLKVIDNQTGEKPGFILSILRFLFFNLTLLSIFGLFISIFRKDKRSLHDLLSGTSIVKIDS